MEILKKIKLLGMVFKHTKLFKGYLFIMVEGNMMVALKILKERDMVF